MFVSTTLGWGCVGITAINIPLCLLLAWQSVKSRIWQTSPGDVICWTALYALGASLCLMTMILEWLHTPGPRHYPILAALTLFFWIGQKLWNFFFNLLLARKFVTNMGTIRPARQLLHMLVFCLAFLFTALVMQRPDKVGLFSYTGSGDGGYYQIDFFLRFYGFFILAAEILSLIMCVGVMAHTVFRGDRAAESDNMLKAELKKAFWFYSAYPVLVFMFSVVPTLIAATEPPGIPDGPSTWFRTVLAMSCFVGEPWAISLWRLWQMRQAGRMWAATDFATQGGGIPIDANHKFHSESVLFALQFYLDVERRREQDYYKAKLPEPSEPHSQPLADLYISEPWKFQLLRQKWGFEYRHQCFCSSPGEDCGENITFENMEVTIEPGEALVDYLNSIMRTEILHNGHESHERLGYYDFMRERNTLLSRVYGAFKIRLHAGPCYSVILKEKFAGQAVEDWVTSPAFLGEEFSRFETTVQDWWPDEWNSLITYGALKESLDFLAGHAAVEYKMLIAKPRQSSGSAAQSGRIACIVNYLKPLDDVKKCRMCGLTSMTAAQYQDEFHARFRIFEEQQHDQTGCYVPGTRFKTLEGKEKRVEELKPGDDVMTLVAGQYALVQDVILLPPRRYNCIELTVGYANGKIIVTQDHSIPVVRASHVLSGTKFEVVNRDGELQNCAARSLAPGNKVIFGDQVTPLKQVRPIPMDTEVYQVVFCPENAAVLTFWEKPRPHGFAYLTTGDPPQPGFDRRRVCGYYDLESQCD